MKGAVCGNRFPIFRKYIKENQKGEATGSAFLVVNLLVLFIVTLQLFYCRTVRRE